MNRDASKDGALLAVDSRGNLYSAYRNGGNWVNGKQLASKDDLNNMAYSAYYKNIDANALGSGIYLLENCSNTPDATTWWLVISSVHPVPKAGAQIAYGLINKNFKRRSYVAGKWEEWEDVVRP